MDLICWSYNDVNFFSFIHIDNNVVQYLLSYHIVTYKRIKSWMNLKLYTVFEKHQKIDKEGGQTETYDTRER